MENRGEKLGNIFLYFPFGRIQCTIAAVLDMIESSRTNTSKDLLFNRHSY